MRRSILVICATALAANALSADANSDFKRFMLRTIPRLESAFDHKSVSFFDRISTADFTETEMGQTTTKAQSMNAMKMGNAQTKSMRAKFKLLSSSASGNTAHAMTYGHFDMVTVARGPKDKPHHMTMDMWDKETWVRSGKAWKLLHDAGFRKIKNVAGGIDAWSEDIDPSVPRY